MKKLLPVVLSGFMAVSFSQLAAAQSVGAGVRGPADTGADVNINNQHGTQNSSTIGSGNQTSQTIGSGNQTTQQGSDSTSTQQSGTQNQSAVGSGNQQTQQYGSGNSASSTGSSSSGASGYDKDKDRDNDRDRDAKHENRGKHEGWKNNKHRDESSGSYRGSGMDASKSE